MLKEARRLYDLGFAVHWIKPGSKAPVKSGWAGDTRDDWATVKADYRKGYGLGVRMGTASKLEDGTFLANIDVDLKGGADQRPAALMLVEEHFPGVCDKAPCVRTDHGLRFFVRTKAPMESRKLGASPKECVVRLPTSEISKRQRLAVTEGKLTQAKLEDGWRVRPAWEVEFMSAGKQVVLPPSIHPETKKPYVWQKPLASAADMPLVKAPGGAATAKPESNRAALAGFVPVAVDLVGSKLSDRIVEMILSGKDVEDRSAACYAAAIAMLRARFTEREILSVLTDRSTHLGETAYEHASTKNRAKAAWWVQRYCIEKAKGEVDAAKAFRDLVEVTPPKLTKKKAAAQKATLTASSKKDWRRRLARSGKEGDGPPKPTLENIVLVLTNVVAPDVFKKDEFAQRDFYGKAAPWGGKLGEALTDQDAVDIKYYLGAFYNFEPPTNLICEAMAWISTRNSFHPVRDELAALPPWDFVPRLDTWLGKYFGAKGPDEYLAQVFRKWLVASVARIYQPGLKFDWMPILEGAQGTGKSSFGSILFGQKWFSDWLPSLQDKDAALGLQGNRCVEFGELDQLRRNELETIKAFVTRQVDKVRPPYGKRTVESYRQTVFFGTTNKDKYLKDETGNRRFNPVKVGRLNFKALARDRQQLWAEAMFIYQNGLEPLLDLDNGAVAHARQIQSNKMVEDESTFMLEALRDFHAEQLAKEDGQFNFNKFKLVSLFKAPAAFQRWPETGRNAQFAATALRAWGAKRTRVHGESWWRKS